MAKVKFIGDIHGCWGCLNEILTRHKCKNLIQVGDMGLGFAQHPYTYLNRNTGLWESKMGASDPETFPDQLKFIRGNHDNPQECEKYSNYLGNYGFNKNIGYYGIFYISGGHSIDKENRTEGVDFWNDEELSYSQFNECIKLYEKIKPVTVVSHECPISIQNEILKGQNIYGYSRTATALQQMFEIWRPNYWIFGHYHNVWKKYVGGTKFVCAAINEVVTLDI